MLGGSENAIKRHLKLIAHPDASGLIMRVTLSRKTYTAVLQHDTFHRAFHLNHFLLREARG